MEDQISELKSEISLLKDKASEITSIRERLDGYIESRKRNYSLLSRLIG